MRIVWILPALVLMSIAPLADANGDSTHVTIVAAEDGCPSGKTFCLKVESGSINGLQPGGTVEVTYRNDGSVEHDLHIADAADADPERHDTPASASIAEVEGIAAGGTGNVTFTVPADATALYYWCDVNGHEFLGMWVQGSVEAPSPPPGGNGDGDGENGTPVPVVLALAALALVARRRR